MAQFLYLESPEWARVEALLFVAYLLVRVLWEKMYLILGLISFQRR